MIKQHITYNITKKDLYQFYKNCYKNGIGKKAKMFYLLVLLSAVILFNDFNQEYSVAINILALILKCLFAILFYTVVVFVLGRITMWIHLSSDKVGKGILGEHTITISEEGFMEETSVNKSWHLWDGIHQIKIRDKQVIFLISPRYGYFVPIRAFACETEARDFCESAKSYKEGFGKL